MTDGPSASDRAEPGESDVQDELRTIAFRLREIQRLLGARVEQENRRLEDEGLTPVTDQDAFRPPEDESGSGE